MGYTVFYSKLIIFSRRIGRDEKKTTWVSNTNRFIKNMKLIKKIDWFQYIDFLRIRPEFDLQLTRDLEYKAGAPTSPQDHRVTLKDNRTKEKNRVILIARWTTSYKLTRDANWLIKATWIAILRSFRASNNRQFSLKSE